MMGKREPRIPGLPATFAEAKRLQVSADALAYAREYVRMVRDEKISWCGAPLSWFEKHDNRRAAMQFMKKAAMDAPLAMLDLVSLARAGADLAYDAVLELIIEHKHGRREMPPPLAAFDMEKDDPRHRRQRQRGKKRADYLMRDIAVTTIVAEVCSNFGLKPTRQWYSKQERPSGCGIVARAMTEEGFPIGDGAVMAIWTRYNRVAFPRGFKPRVFTRR